MADVDVNITMRAAGGSDSAGEIARAENAINNLTSSSSGLEEKFQHRFQHMGLMLFAGDALRASGLGREARVVITTLNLALTEGAAAAGLSSGGLMLVVTAMAALAGIAAKVIEHHKGQAEALEKLVTSQQTSLRGYEDEISILKRVGEGKSALAQADRIAADDIRENLTKSINLEIVALKSQQESILMTAQAHLVWAEVMEEGFRTTERFGLNLHLVAAGLGQLKKWISDMIPSFKDHTRLVGEARTNYDKLEAKIQSFLFALQHGGKDVKTFGEENKKSSEDAIKHWGDAAEAMQKDFEKQAKFVEKTVNQIGSDIGNAFSQSLVEGKSFTESMKDAFHKMAEQIISDLIAMIVKMAIFNAMSGGMFGDRAASFGMAGLKSLGMATGGQAIVDRPTLFMAGDNGPELATFTPLSGAASRGSSGGGGGGTTYNMPVSVMVSGVNDPDRIARQVGKKIIENIRGSGELSFSRK